MLQKRVKSARPLVPCHSLNPSLVCSRLLLIHLLLPYWGFMGFAKRTAVKTPDVALSWSLNLDALRIGFDISLEGSIDIQGSSRNPVEKFQANLKSVAVAHSCSQKLFLMHCVRTASDLAHQIRISALNIIIVTFCPGSIDYPPAPIR